MHIHTVSIAAFAGQKPGTSGLRKPTREFQQPHYLEAFIQSIFDVIGEAKDHTLILGGDGRYHNRVALQTTLRMAAANGFGRIIVGRDGLLSTPAASCIIRKRQAIGGLILSASHNSGGVDGDFGVKYNIGSGGPAPEAVTEAIYQHTQRLTAYRIAADNHKVNLTDVGEQRFGQMTIEVIDPIADYVELLEALFDFDAICDLFASGFRMRFDAMHAVTGPYARDILENRLGAVMGTVVRGDPREDFGGGPPDPNLVHAKELVTAMFGQGAPEFAAASDGDGDRNMILGRHFYVTPSDSLAIIAENAHLCPGYRDGLAGVARSMPTSRALDRVAQALGVPCFETPTGWKFFSSLLEGGRVTVCGEESFGTGSHHVREKDGLWAVLMWLNIIAVRRCSVADIVRDQWARLGRTMYLRHDYEGLDQAVARDLMQALRGKVAGLAKRCFNGKYVELADDFSYVDPVSGAVSSNQGVRVIFADGSRVVYRLSGTGSRDTALRVYLECHEPDPARHGVMPQVALRPLIGIADDVAALSLRTGRSGPSVVT